MSDLRNKLVKLAHENPELRKDILPLLNKQASPKMQVMVGGREVGRPVPQAGNASSMGAYEKKLMVMYGIKAGSYQLGQAEDQGYGNPGTFNRTIRSWTTSSGKTLEIVLV
ncbi:MAG TPA: hypothetical protein V6D20_01925 [Candidatus Obscuribacterales bacterium]